MRRVALPPTRSWWPLVERSLDEDLGGGDLTSQAVIPDDQRARAVIEARQPLVACGLDIAASVLSLVDADLVLEVVCRDGDRVDAGAPLVRIEGNLRGILAAERSALNFLGRLCGIATHTRRFCDAVAGTGACIVDTRKTLPGWRVLDKYATAVGGAINHRSGLFDGILIKDNHIAGAGGVSQAVTRARSAAPPHLRIQVEVESLDAARAAIEAGADSLLVDNLGTEDLAAIVRAFGQRALIEASGGIRLDNVRRYAETGVHRISVGALTHSAPGADVALELATSAAERQGA